MDSRLRIGLLVGVGGMAGTAVRLFVSAAASSDLPWATLAVNLAGSALAGYLVGRRASSRSRAMLGFGFAGSLTTFSTLMAESVTLAWWGPLYLVGTIAAGVLMVRVGRRWGEMDS